MKILRDTERVMMVVGVGLGRSIAYRFQKILSVAKIISKVKKVLK